jgi:phospholipase/lecithinase/hemolysin
LREVHTESFWDEFTAKFNDTLVGELDAVGRAFPGVKIVSLNMTGLIDGIVSDPLGPSGSYDFTNVTDAACPGCNFAGLPPGPIADSPDEFLIWDQSHFTAAVHRIIGDSAYDELLTAFPTAAPLGNGQTVPEPATWLLTIASAAAWCGKRRTTGKRVSRTRSC